MSFISFEIPIYVSIGGIIQFIPSSRGNKVLLVYNGYKYANMSRSKARWYCSSKNSRNCNAKVITTEDGQFVYAIGEHAHPATLPYNISDGRFYKF